MIIINKQEYILQVVSLLDAFFEIPDACEITIFTHASSSPQYDKVNLYYHYSLCINNETLLGGSSDELFIHHKVHGDTLAITHTLQKTITHSYIQKDTITAQDHLLNSLNGIVLNRNNWEKTIVNIIGNEIWKYYQAKKSYDQLQELLPNVHTSINRTKI